MKKNTNKRWTILSLDNPTQVVPSLLAAVCMLLLITVGCSDDDGGTTGPELSAQELVDEGWDKFEEDDWNGALTDFRSAIDRDINLSDAYNGAGWASGKSPDGLNNAADYFDVSLQKDTTRYDALGGWAFVVYQQGEWQLSIEKAEYVLHRRPGWRFLHQSSLDFNDLRLMMTTAWCNLDNYDTAYNIVIDYLNPTFETDITTPEGRRELLEEIERLRRIYG
ncbi:MAG: hypothetical protein P9M15_01570 [Candidatus Electryoneaceae bacterium]|nr:hypothetical protein [Candidatus Electryoneaceae bacterium]